jgi:hypothetical protein
MFAGIPLVFGVQQLAEGVLWITLPDPDLLLMQTIATYVFLAFAQIIWPIWVPISIILLEKRDARNRMQKILVGAGILVGLYLAYSLVVFQVEANIMEYHISYFQDYPPSLKKYVVVLYALATIAPPLFSHIKRMWMLGIAILISYILATIFYEHYVLSVWCFFSSIISISVYLIIKKIAAERYIKK